ncbi:hypothetical protein CDD83_9747 [Cordyceps sp. RAO-2017]|nr:hypothetical protein CDD83_9747 [Cordyceps sp. RAO-2017]
MPPRLLQQPPQYQDLESIDSGTRLASSNLLRQSQCGGIVDSDALGRSAAVSSASQVRPGISMMASPRSVAIVGAGVFGLSIALALRKRGYRVVVFDQEPYDSTAYAPSDDGLSQAASVDHNKIFRASYGTKLHYQRLALDSRAAWLALDAGRLLSPCGMLRVQPTGELGSLERETLAGLARDGLRDTQFVRGDAADRARAVDEGWDAKLLAFCDAEGRALEAVLDSLAGFVRCSDACAFVQRSAASEGVEFRFGPEEGAFDSLVEETESSSSSSSSTPQKRVIGLKTKDGTFHPADTVVIAAGSYSTQLLPELAYHLESSAGSLATFRIDRSERALWDKYAPDRFPVITWKSAPRAQDGRDMGSVYALPRTPEGLVKIGYRGIKFTNFQPAPAGAPFTQQGEWSVPLPRAECSRIPPPAEEAIRTFVSLFLPEFRDVPFYSQRLCWYTDSLDNSFLIDYVPVYADRSVFVCAGGSGHGAKFLPVLGEHAADIFEHGDASASFMRPFWRWRPDAPRRNGLDEGPDGPRNLARMGDWRRAGP